MPRNFADDVRTAKRLLSKLPCDWEGKKCVLQLKEADYNWRQMEWWGFFFEWMCRERLRKQFSIPGERFNRVQFDARRSVN